MNRCPLLSRNRTANGDRLVTYRVDGGNSGIGRKMVENRNNGIEEPRWSDTRIIVIPIDLYQRRKPVLIKFDCDLDSKSELELIERKMVTDL